MKKKSTALVLSILCGTLGIDRFYLGYTGLGILKLFTFGGALILYILDIIHIVNGELKPADGSNYSDNENDSPYKKLEEIARLHDAGILTEEEYIREKEKLLGSGTGKVPTDQKDPYKNLELLAKFHDAGTLSDAEYDKKKSKLLKDIMKMETPVQLLEKLARQKEKGDLTPEQFEQMKKEVLKKI